MKKNNKKGFTLVELVIVVAVMAVLVAVAIPTIGSIKSSAENSVAKSNAKTIESIIKMSEADNGSIDPQLVATKIFEAKLGITATSTAKEYYYNPDDGVVYIKADVDKAGSNKWTIVFGKVTVSAAGAADAGVAAGDYNSGVKITLTTALAAGGATEFVGPKGGTFN